MLVGKIVSKVDEIEKIIADLLVNQPEGSSVAKELIKLGGELRMLELNIKSLAKIKFRDIDNNITSINFYLNNLSGLLSKKDYLSLLTRIESIKGNLFFKRIFYYLFNFNWF
ncbi:hypothetical protein AQULUS_11190 [Aquicella lusitana]|uniref:Uncharacterized protein n=2 Tax=Aquicella lusitana TaxID=254246 RepID=A0A370GVS0_9COXI|nr:hypothetical protein C8D86_10627 [Aquicella lusitana]VVC73380.1 hypothetical protein AQULUS_11190 [Aquicella lusitana]